MKAEERKALEQVAAEVEALEAVRIRLLGIRASLPEAPAESAALADLDEVDLVTEIRSVIGCVLEDSIEPAIRDLQFFETLSGEPETKARKKKKSR
jgi:hypothetical protein